MDAPFVSVNRTANPPSHHTTHYTHHPITQPTQRTRHRHLRRQQTHPPHPLHNDPPHKTHAPQRSTHTNRRAKVYKSVGFEPPSPLIKGERAGSGGILHAQQFVNSDRAVGTSTLARCERGKTQRRANRRSPPHPSLTQWREAGAGLLLSSSPRSSRRCLSQPAPARRGGWRLHRGTYTQAHPPAPLAAVPLRCSSA